MDMDNNASSAPPSESPKDVLAAESAQSEHDDMVEETAATLTDLPTELCLLIFTFLPATDLGRLAQVCCYMNELIRLDEVWEPRYQSQWKYKMAREEKIPMRSMYITRSVIERSWTRPPRPFILAGHQEWVTSIGYDHEGYIITVSDDGISKRWDPRSYLCCGTMDTLNLGSIPKCTKKSRCLDFDDAFIIGARDRTICVWDSQQRLLHALEGHTHTIDALEMQGSIAVSGSKDRTVRVWDLKEGKCSKIFRGHEMGVIALQFDIEHNTIVSCSWDKTVIVWQLDADEDNAMLARLYGHTEAVTCISACFRNGFIVSGSKDKTVRVWSLETMSCVHVLHAHTRPVLSVAMDDFRIVSGGKDRSAVVWEVVPGHFALGMEFDEELNEKKKNVRLATVVAREEDSPSDSASEEGGFSSVTSSSSEGSPVPPTNMITVTRESIEEAKCYHANNNHLAWASAAAVATALDHKSSSLSPVLPSLSLEADSSDMTVTAL